MTCEGIHEVKTTTMNIRYIVNTPLNAVKNLNQFL